ncbi:hypothetical protein CYJ73_26105 [Gordonia terrae]|uniref:ER-bound oxygenase mpaB/mpaB'/Rubber oxygenase catalytic domain-containing protein n=1 Tax=Gordonia terrae TaxID=2055 RepID=A0A2I1R0K7_9ACTN|nr:hypothetical protein CYJ73_26105 [Gordonia terrae]
MGLGTFIRPLKEYYECFHGALSPSDVEKYYNDCRQLALLFGIDQANLPKDWDGFVKYFDDFVTSPAMDLSDEFLRRSSLLSGDVEGSWKVRGGSTWLLCVVAYRLPLNIRRQYPGLPTARRHRALAVATLGAIRVLWSWLPKGLRDSSRARTALRRTGVECKKSRLSDWVATLPAPYGSSYAEANLSAHGNPVGASK